MATVTDPDERDQEREEDLNKGKDMYQKGKEHRAKAKEKRQKKQEEKNKKKNEQSSPNGGNKKDNKNGNNKNNKDKKDDKNKDNKNKSDDKKSSTSGGGTPGKPKKGGAANAAKSAAGGGSKEDPVKKAEEAVNDAREIAQAAAGDGKAAVKQGIKQFSKVTGSDSGDAGTDLIIGIIVGFMMIFLMLLAPVLLLCCVLAFIFGKIASFFANFLHLNDGVKYDEMTREEQYEFIAEIIHDKVKESYDEMIDEWRDDIETLSENPQFNEFGMCMDRDYHENEDAATIQEVINKNEEDQTKPLRFGCGHDAETIAKSTTGWALSAEEYRGWQYYPIGMRNLVNDKDENGDLYGDAKQFYPVGRKKITTQLKLYGQEDTTPKTGYYKGFTSTDAEGKSKKDDEGAYMGAYLRGNEPVVDMIKSSASFNDSSNNGAISDMAYLVASYNIARCDMPISESNSWLASTFKSYYWDISQGTFWKGIGQFCGLYSYFEYEASAVTVPEQTEQVTVKDSSGNELAFNDLDYDEHKTKIVLKSNPSEALTATNNEGESVPLDDIMLSGDGGIYAHKRTVLYYNECLWLDAIVKKILNYSLVVDATANDPTADRAGLVNPLYSQEKLLQQVKNPFEVETLDLSKKDSNGMYLNRDFDGMAITDSIKDEASGEENQILISGSRWDKFVTKYGTTTTHTPYGVADGFTHTSQYYHDGGTLCHLPSNVPTTYDAGVEGGSQIVPITWDNNDSSQYVLKDERYTKVTGANSTKKRDEYKYEAMGKDYKGDLLYGYKEGSDIWGYDSCVATSDKITKTLNGYYTNIPSSDIQNLTADKPFKYDSVSGYVTEAETAIEIDSSNTHGKLDTSNHYYQKKLNGFDVDEISMEWVNATGTTPGTTLTATRLGLVLPADYRAAGHGGENDPCVVFNTIPYYLSYQFTDIDKNGNGINPQFVLYSANYSEQGAITSYTIYTFTKLKITPRKVTKTNFSATKYQHKYQKYSLKDYGITLKFTVDHPTTDNDFNTTYVKKDIKTSFNHSTYKYTLRPYDYTYLKAESDPFKESAFVEVLFEAGGYYDDPVYQYSLSGYMDENDNFYPPQHNIPISKLYPDAPKDSEGRQYLSDEWTDEYGIKKFPYRRSITMFQYQCSDDIDECAMGTKDTCSAEDPYNTLITKAPDDGHYTEFKTCGCGAPAIQECNNEKGQKIQHARTQVIQSPYTETRQIKKQGAKGEEVNTVVQTVEDAINENLEYIKESLENYEEVQTKSSNGASAPSAAGLSTEGYEDGTDLEVYIAGLILKHETSEGYVGVNPCDPNDLSDPPHGSISVGKIQYNADGARDLLRNIIKADEKTAEKLWKEYSKYEEAGADNLFYTKKIPAAAGGSDSWEHTGSIKHTVCKHTVPDWESYLKALKKLLNTKAAKKAQDHAIIGRIRGYIKDIKADYGITDPACIAWLADIRNQYGRGGLRSVFGNMIQGAINGAGGADKLTLKDLWKAYSKGSAGKQYKTRRKKVYDLILADSKTGKLPKDMVSQHGSGYGEGVEGGGTAVSFPADGSTIKVTYYNQADGWGNIGPSEIKSSGCGPTATSMVLATYGKTVNGKTANPKNVSDYFWANDYYVPGAGSKHIGIPQTLSHFGVKTRMPSSKQDIVDAIKAGQLVIGMMGPGHFTRGGHFIVLAGITKTGNILVADPGSRSRTASKEGFSLDDIWNEAKKCHGVADFWICVRDTSKPA